MNSIVQKPWGYYEILKSGKRFLVKKLFVKPGGMLSLQNHDHRSEHWLVAEGEAEAFRYIQNQYGSFYYRLHQTG